MATAGTQKNRAGWNMPKVNQSALPGEALLVSAAVIVIGAGLFEWVVISPDHPLHALLRVLASGVAATVILLPFRKA